MAAVQSEAQSSSAPAVSQTKSKAAEGARMAALAASSANHLHQRTLKSIQAAALQDLSLPFVPVSPLGYSDEAQKAASASAAPDSPWFLPAEIPLLQGAPASESDPAFVALAQAGLRGLSLNGIPMSMETSVVLQALLAPGCDTPLEVLRLARALDPAQAPPVSSALLSAAVAEVERSFGPKSGETEVDEKVQAAVEKAKGEFTTVEEGLKFLARKQLNRLRTLFAAVGGNTSLKEVDLSRNGLGAPVNGRSNFAPLRLLASALDRNGFVERLNLSNNGFGPVGTGIIAKAMCKNIGVHTLDLGGNDVLGDPADEEEDAEQEEEDPVFGELQAGLESLSEVLKKNKFLRCLCLRNNRIRGEVDADGDDDGAETPLGKFLEPFKKYHRLEVLDLACNALGAGGARMLANALENNRSIRVLDVSDNAIGPQGLPHLARLVKASRSLTTLAVASNALGGKKGKKATRAAAAALAAFGDALGASVSLRSLDLSGNHLGPDLSLLVLARLPTMPLETLRFDSNDLCGGGIPRNVAAAFAGVAAAGGAAGSGGDGSGAEDGDAAPSPQAAATAFAAAAVAAATAASGPPPATADAFDGRALRIVVAALDADGSTLRHLHLGENSLRADGVALLTANGATLSAVHTLSLGRNAIGDAGLAALATYFVEHQPCVHTLDVSWNGIADVRPLGGVIRANASLRTLNLAHNAIGSSALLGGAAGVAASTASLGALLDAIAARGNLHALDLQANDLGEAHAAMLTSLCTTATAPLRSVSLRHNPGVSLVHARSIVAALRNNTCIRQLSLTSQAGDHADLVKALAVTLETNKTISDVDLSIPTDERDDAAMPACAAKLLHNALRTHRL